MKIEFNRFQSDEREPLVVEFYCVVNEILGNPAVRTRFMDDDTGTIVKLQQKIITPPAHEVRRS
jgi:hypothetical protein